MRFDLQARFIAILLLAGIVALAAMYAIGSQQRAHDRVVAASVQALLDRSAAQQPADEQMQGEITARIEAAHHRYRIELMLTLAVLGLILAGIALLVLHGLVQPIRRLADSVRRIEAGENAVQIGDTQRNDEIGDLSRAYGAMRDALVALRQRMDHDAAARPEQNPVAQAPSTRASTTMVFPDAAVSSSQRSAVTAVRDNASAIAAAHSADPRDAIAAVEPEPVPATTKRDAARRLRLEDDLREAWQRGEMSVVYQPIHALADAGMRGAEALLRWQHPVEGAVEPAEFIPLAERSDLIIALGRFVLIQACADAGLWPSGGTPETTPFLSVNVSARQLHGTQLFEAVVEALRRSGLAASRLHLELPVAALRSDDSAIAATVGQLRGLGVRIWLDAVGADAADQARWMKMPVDGVKVGRNRIAGKPDDAADTAATGAIVATAHALRVVAVVVGVEELAQLDLLRAQGAEFAQGYVLCKPVDSAEIGRRLLA